MLPVESGQLPGESDLAPAQPFSPADPPAQPVAQLPDPPVNSPGQAVTIPIEQATQALAPPAPANSPGQIPEPVELPELLSPLSATANQPDPPLIPVALPVISLTTQTEDLITGLLTGLSETVGGLSHSVTDTLAPDPETPNPPVGKPITTLPEFAGLLPILNTAPKAIEKPAVTLAQPPPAATPRATPAVAKQPHAVFTASAEARATTASTRAEQAEQAEENEPSLPSPGKAPTPAPAGGAPTATTAHDTSSGARGINGFLTPQAPIAPPSTEFTTRGRATGAPGRVAGLPATSPD